MVARGGAGSGPRVIDAHVHVCVLDEEHYPFTPLLGYLPAEPAPVEALIARLDACGVDAAVLVQPSYYGYDNRYLLECLARYPQRLSGVCLADPVGAHFAEACRGVRLNAVGHPGSGWLTQTAVAGFWRKAEEDGIVVCVQCGPEQVAELTAVAMAHPGAACVIDHLARGAWDDLLAAAEVRNLFLKLSGLSRLSAEPYPHRDLWPRLAALVRAFGPERCLWGSDANGVAVAPYRAQVELWRDVLPLGTAERQHILAGTAQRLFFDP